MPVSSYPNGFANGLTVRGMPINIAFPGKVFWLNNSSTIPDNGIGGSNSNKGTYLQPFSTLVSAVSQCKAGRGDVIMVMPNHAETISSSTGCVLATSGVAIVGLGYGDIRPTFTLDTAVGATVSITAANIAIINCLFKANFADITSCCTVGAKNFTLQDCEFRDNSSILNFAKIVLTSAATSNLVDGLTIENCKWYGLGATSASSLLGATGTNNRWTIKNNYVTHAAVTGAGLCPISAGKVLTNFLCLDNIFNLVGATSLTDGTLITTNGSTNSGVIARNYVQCLDATTEILCTAASGFTFFENYSSAVADKSGYLLPGADG